MPRGDRYGTERIDRTDADTGLLVRQITSFPAISLHLHYETPTFTPDGSRMLFVTMRMPVRGAPWDVASCASDGREIVKLNSDTDSGASNVCMTVDGQYALYMEGGVCHRTHMETAEDDEIGAVDGAEHRPYYRGARSFDGRYYFSTVMLGEDVAIIRWDLRNGEHVIVETARGVNHPKANPGGPEIQYGVKQANADGSVEGRSVCIHCDTLEPIQLALPTLNPGAAHSMWLGKTGRYAATRKFPKHQVVVMQPGTDHVDIVAEGPYFWHCGASYDGKWIVADTNWPDEGLWLINVASKQRTRLCFAHASQGHPQYTHTHPNLNDDGSMAVFSSDRTGITQVYTVTIPEETRQELTSA